jgi:hypothetical protein
MWLKRLAETAFSLWDALVRSRGATGRVTLHLRDRKRAGSLLNRFPTGGFVHQGSIVTHIGPKSSGNFTRTRPSVIVQPVG